MAVVQVGFGVRPRCRLLGHGGGQAPCSDRAGGSGQYGGLYSSVDLYLPGVDAWQPDILPPLGCVPDDGSSVRGRSGLALHLASEGSTELLYAVGGNIGISLPTRCDESSVPPVIDLVFGDGFKTASTSRWSAAVP